MKTMTRLSCRRILAMLWIIGTPVAAQNPNGFIESEFWACLVPLQGNDCTGGGTVSMLQNWFAPHDVATENPVVGTIWNDIDFGGAAKSAAYRGDGDPTFVDIGPGSDPDLVDFQEYLVENDLTNDFVMGVAVTYIENTTDGPLTVGMCTASDDAIQVWVNNSLVTNKTICRPTRSDCEELPTTVLAKGVNRVTVLLWEGFGGFSFRLALLKESREKYTDADDEIVVLGAEDGGAAAVPFLNREYDGGDFLVPNDIQRVQLSGQDFEDGTSYEVVETIRGKRLTSGSVSATHDGQFEVVVSPDEVGDFKRAVVGPACNENNHTTLIDEIYTTRATTGYDIWADGDAFEYAYTYLEGDFDVAVEVIETRFPPGGRWGKFGVMARQTLDLDSRFGMIQDHGPDLQDPARYALRSVHQNIAAMSEPANTGGLIDPLDGFDVSHPRYLRLTRRGDTLDGWVSNSVGEEGVPEEDADWVHVYTDVWFGAPLAMYVGFAYGVHNSSGCQTGEIDWTVVHLEGEPGDEPEEGPFEVEIRWEVPGSVLNGDGVSYEVAASPGVVASVWGRAGGGHTQGPGVLPFQAPSQAAVGIFDRAHDIGNEGPCTPGSLEHEDQGTDDPLDDTYTMTASGRDIWAIGDDFHYAYQVVSGDFAIEAHFTEVISPPVGGRWGKFGLMARWDCSSNSAYAFVHNGAATNFDCDVDGPRTAGRPTSGINGGNAEPNWMWWQDVFGDEPIDPACAALNPDPRANDLRGDERNLAPWLRLVRRGSGFYGYASEDGEKWLSLGTYGWVDAPETLLVGVAMTSHARCEIQEISFDNVTIGPAPALDRTVDDDATGLATMTDFDGGEENECPEGWSCNTWGTGGGFVPQLVDGRLRMADIRNSLLGSGEDTGTTAFLREPIDPHGAYRFEFDVYFNFDSVAAGEAEPADGLTFTMLGTDTYNPVPPTLPDPEIVGEFARRAIGFPCSPLNTETTFDGATYTTHAETGGDIWADGDTFEFAYKVVEGDFDLSIELLDRRFPPTGRWGKFGLMARRSLDNNSKFISIQDHGPLAPDDDSGRAARRLAHRVVANMDEPANTEGLLDPVDGEDLKHPRFMRITRRRNTFDVWVANSAPDDPTNDDAWAPVYTDTWFFGAPPFVYAGFIYSVHNSSGCAPGEIDWRLVHFEGKEIPEPEPEVIEVDPFAFDLRLGDRGGSLAYHRINLSQDERTLSSKDLSLNSFAVEFDNWHNGQGVNDGDGGNVSGFDALGGELGTGTGPYHMGVLAGASLFSGHRNINVGVHDDDLPDIYHPDGLHTRVLYDNGAVKVWVAPNNGETDELLVLDTQVEPVGLNAEQALVGFTAATGGRTCTVEVDNFVVENLSVSGSLFRRGDPTDNGAANISSAVSILSFLFTEVVNSLPCKDAADIDNDGTINIADPINLLNHLFGPRPPPAPPGAVECGPDPDAPGSPGDLGCESYDSC